MELDEIMPQGQGFHFQHQNRMGGGVHRCVPAFTSISLYFHGEQRSGGTLELREVGGRLCWAHGIATSF